jgi:hypothetical protein
MTFSPLYKGIPAHHDGSDSKQKTITPSNHLIFNHLTPKVIDNSFFIKIKMLKKSHIIHEDSPYSPETIYLILFSNKKDKVSLIYIIICIFAAEKTKRIDKI